MICLYHKYIYIEPEKTGSTSISEALWSYCEKDHIQYGCIPGRRPAEERPTISKEFYLSRNEYNKHHLPSKDERFYHIKKHSWAEEYYRVFGEEIKEYRIIASTRNPFDRAVSAVAHSKRTPIWLSGGDDLYLTKIKKIRKEDFFFFANIVDMCRAGGTVIVDDFIRLENIEDDFYGVLEKLGIPKINLPHKNYSNRDRDYRSYYTKNTMLYVKGVYKKDLDYFGYEF